MCRPGGRRLAPAAGVPHARRALAPQAPPTAVCPLPAPPMLDTYGFRDFPLPPPPQQHPHDPHPPQSDDPIPCEPARWLGPGPGGANPFAFAGRVSPDIMMQAVPAGSSSSLPLPVPVTAFPPLPPRNFHALRVPDQGECQCRPSLSSHVTFAEERAASPSS
jgi:hypothetical protein